jgi:hypothetical protein
MVRTLRDYDAGVLAEAAQTIIATRTPKDGRFFPLPSECIELCNRIRAGRDLKLLPAPTVKPGYESEFSEDRHALALDLCKSSIGRRAAADGWLGTLHAFCRRHMRPPTGAEVEACRSEAAVFAEALDACERGEGGTLSGPLARLGRSIAARTAQVRAKVAS